MNPLALHNKPEWIQRKTKQIHARTLEQAPNLDAANFTVISAADVAVLFKLYDQAFFNSWLSETVAQKSHKPLAFRVSSRMTRAGGKTTTTRRRGSKSPSFEIAVASQLLFMSFDTVDRPVVITGITCQNRLEALQRILEHEIIHLAEILAWGDSSCNQPRFKTLASNIFGHTDVCHQLVTPAEHAHVNHSVTVGSLVRFTFEGETLTGRINRIHQRATVLVESDEGMPYSDGKRYEKYYIPLQMLEKV